LASEYYLAVITSGRCALKARPRALNTVCPDAVAERPVLKAQPPALTSKAPAFKPVAVAMIAVHPAIKAGQTGKKTFGPRSKPGMESSLYPIPSLLISVSCMSVPKGPEENFPYSGFRTSQCRIQNISDCVGSSGRGFYPNFTIVKFTLNRDLLQKWHYVKNPDHD
jgi:hypothetical protein